MIRKNFQFSIFNFHNRDGFTLIEILVVATIIALLSTVGLTSYQAANRNGRDSKRKSDVEQIRSALEINKSDSGSYPIDLNCVATTLAPGGYINPYPTDPQPTNQYCYKQLGSGTGYEICAHLDNIKPTVACSAGVSCGGTCTYRVTNP